MATKLGSTSHSVKDTNHQRVHEENQVDKTIKLNSMTRSIIYSEADINDASTVRKLGMFAVNFVYSCVACPPFLIGKAIALAILRGLKDQKIDEVQNLNLDGNLFDQQKQKLLNEISELKEVLSNLIKNNAPFQFNKISQILDRMAKIEDFEKIKLKDVVAKKGIIPDQTSFKEKINAFKNEIADKANCYDESLLRDRCLKIIEDFLTAQTHKSQTAQTDKSHMKDIKIQDELQEEVLTEIFEREKALSDKKDHRIPINFQFKAILETLDLMLKIKEDHIPDQASFRDEIKNLQEEIADRDHSYDVFSLRDRCLELIKDFLKAHAFKTED